MTISCWQGIVCNFDMGHECNIGAYLKYIWLSQQWSNFRIDIKIYKITYSTILKYFIAFSIPILSSARDPAKSQYFQAIPFEATLCKCFITVAITIASYPSVAMSLLGHSPCHKSTPPNTGPSITYTCNLIITSCNIHHNKCFSHSQCLKGWITQCSQADNTDDVLEQGLLNLHI